jgi:hypothetical protein
MKIEQFVPEADNSSSLKDIYKSRLGSVFPNSLKDGLKTIWLSWYFPCSHKRRNRDLLVIGLDKEDGMNAHLLAILTIVALAFGAWIVGH